MDYNTQGIEKTIENFKRHCFNSLHDQPAVRSHDACHTHRCVKYRKTGRVAATEDKEALYVLFDVFCSSFVTI